MKFVSTRGGEEVTAAEAIVRGMSEDGGLYVPETFPKVTAEEFDRMLSMDYAERTALLLGKFFEEFEGAELLGALQSAYAQFEGEDPAPLVRLDNGMYMLELFHGPTCAFQDVALAAFPHLLDAARKLAGIGEDALVLSAAGGDTGKAALERFCDRAGAKVMVFYPEEGVSKMQKFQMCTQDGENLSVVAVRGSGDDCRAGVAKVLRSEACRAAARGKGYVLTTADSVNFGRLAPQICYFFSAYCDLVTSDQIAMGDKVDFTVPTGNGGNLLAGYYAMRMGLPVGRLVCASNKNCALTDLWKAGTYDVKRPLYRTMSPSMDVLLSANAERLIFELSGRDGALVAERMKALSSSGKYSLRAEELKAMKQIFFAGSASEDETVECVYDFFEEYGYPMDTHTGVAMNVAQMYEAKLEEDTMSEVHPMVVLSTASPYKCPQDVLYALTGNDVKDSFKGVKRIHLLTAMKVPEPIKAIRYKPIRFKTAISADKIEEEVMKFLG